MNTCLKWTFVFIVDFEHVLAHWEVCVFINFKTVSKLLIDLVVFCFASLLITGSSMT